MRADFVVPVDDRAPDFLTVEEAGAVLRFSRSKSYELACEYLATGGASGMPVIRLGRQLRVPRSSFEQWIGGPITWPIPTQTRASAAIASITPAPTGERATRRAVTSPDQDALPFPA